MPTFRTAAFATAAAALALAASPAAAQDDTRTSYDGFYVAGSIGAAFQNNDRRDTVLFDINGDGVYGDTVTTTTGANAFSPGFCNGKANAAIVGGLCKKDDNDLEYAIKVGMDGHLTDHFVVGVVLEGSKTDLDDGTSAFSTTPASYTFVRGLDYAISARGRFGFTPDGSGLFYVTGGPSYAQLDHDFTTTNTANTFDQRGGDRAWGYQMGGGVEFTLAQGLGVGIEYLYSKYDDEDYFVHIERGTAAATNPFIRQFGATDFHPSDRDLDFHAIRVNAIYKF
ncbi:MAG TPA: outer membrane beta-barrel protein [Novosphingobium sp.]|nr:outer membrane beta-barrel protein [Novosphingobium sp.]